MNETNSRIYFQVLSKSNKNTRHNENNRRQDFWNGTLVDDYNFLMSEELICRCKGSLSEPFNSLNDLSVHHVSYNEFEKQYGELSEWCDKISKTITKNSSNALTRYLRQAYYEELYEQGLMRLRLFDQYADKLTERFPDLKFNINEKLIQINRQWNSLESRFIDYLDEDFDRVLQDLHNELLLFEKWLNKTEQQLWTFQSIHTDDISLEDFQSKLNQHTKLQDEIKSRNSRVSSIIEICERLKTDYEQQISQIPYDFASDLENRWHQTWIDSVEIQCKLEERLKSFKNSTPLIQIDKEEDDDDIIPFNSSEYEKIPLTPSNSSIDSLNFPQKKTRQQHSQSSLILNLNNPVQSKSFYLKRQMARSKQRMSLNLLPINSPSTMYYSLTNINDIDDKIIEKKQKKTLSILDVGYESEDENNHSDSKHFHTKSQLKKSQSDFSIGQKVNNKNRFTLLTHSLPILEHNHHLPTWWRHSITSAYDTCSNPDIDLSIEETKKVQTKTSLLMYSKKYTKYKRIKTHSQQPLYSLSANNKSKPSPSNPASNSYDASAEYTDPEQSENDIDVLSSDFNSNSPAHHYQTSGSKFYNRYTTTTTTTTTGYSSDVELETTTTPSETEDQHTPHTGEVSKMKIDALTLPLLANSDGFDSLNTIISPEKIESSEPCWDGYQNPLFYPLNSQDMDSIETTLKWEDQFLEMDQPNNSSSDDELYLNDKFNYSLRKTNGSSSSLTGTGGNKQVLDSDSDLDDFNYVLNETERQLYKARQSLEKKKRQQPFALNDRNLRKYDEVLRTCETNIQCLQQILKNLHRSKNSRLNSAKAIEQLQTYLSSWHDMQQQVNDDRIRARQLLYISQEIIKLKIRLDEEFSQFSSIHNQNHPWLDDTSISEIKHRINYELESDREYRQKLAAYRADIYQAEQHLQEYRMSNIDSPSSSTSSNIDEHLHSCRLTLEQLTDTMNTYQTQLRQLSTIIDNLLPIETQIEQKLTAYDCNQIDLPDVQRLVDKYEQLMPNLNRSMIPINALHLKLKSHCECKLDLYRKMLNELFRKSQSKHVSFDGSSNYNNNNSSSTYQHYFQDNIREKKYRKTDTYTTTSDDYNPGYYGANKQSSTSSYISDDCKVLYIETVIEVAKPVFYERTNDTLTTTNSEYHHQHRNQNPAHSIVTDEYHHQHHNQNPSHSIVTDEYHPIQHSNSNTFRSTTSNFYEKRKQIPESSDDDSSKPVNLTASTSSKSQIDSGIEYDQTSPPTLSSSNSTIYNKVLIPPRASDFIFDETTSQIQTKLVRRTPTMKPISTVKTQRTVELTTTSTTHSYWNRLREIWLRSLLLGLLLLLFLFFVYFSRLDTCSRSILVRTVFRKIICIEDEGLPTI